MTLESRMHRLTIRAPRSRDLHRIRDRVLYMSPGVGSSLSPVRPSQHVLTFTFTSPLPSTHCRPRTADDGRPTRNERKRLDRILQVPNTRLRRPRRPSLALEDAAGSSAVSARRSEVQGDVHEGAVRSPETRLRAVRHGPAVVRCLCSGPPRREDWRQAEGR